MCMCLHCAHRVKSEDWQIHASLFHRADTLPFNQQACGTCFCLQSLVRDKVNILSDGLQHVISPCNRPVTALPSKTLNFRDWIHRSTLALLWGFDSFSVPYTRGSRFFFLLFIFVSPLYLKGSKWMCHSKEKKEEAQGMKPSLQASVSLIAEVVTAGCSNCFQCLGYHFLYVRNNDLLKGKRRISEINKSWLPMPPRLKKGSQGAIS